MVIKIRNTISCWLAVTAFLSGCTATQTFTAAARPGDTVALAVGWNKPVNRNNLTVTFQPTDGVPVTYNPGDNRIKAVTQLYPDLVSNVVVGTQTGQQTVGGTGMNYAIGYFINQDFTQQDPDWNQTVVYLNLPTTLPVGTTNITLAGPSGNLTVSPLQVNVLAGAGQSNPFYVDGAIIPQAGSFVRSMERSNYYTISFNAPTIPYAIQVELTRTTGTGVPWVVNTRGDLKNLAWRDDGASNIRVMLTPSRGVPMADLKGFKFYVAGGVTGLTATSVTAYDIAGNPVPDVTANVTFIP